MISYYYLTLDQWSNLTLAQWSNLDLVAPITIDLVAAQMYQTGAAATEVIQ